MIGTNKIAVAQRVLGLIDLTNLNDVCTEHDIHSLCENALGHGHDFGHTAAVCVWPGFVAQSRRELTGSGVHIATVVNFPHGGPDISGVIHETQSALADGADEIDLVFPYKAFAMGDIDTAREQIEAVRAVIPAGASLKVILETGELEIAELIKSASHLALEAGADFINTSTGKVQVNATLEATDIMLNAIADSGKKAGFKPAGGIRSVAEAAHYLALADDIMGPEWTSPETFRFGATSLLDDVLAILQGSEGPSGDGGY